MNQQQRQSQLKDWLNDNTAFNCSQLSMVSGDASFRRYFRFSDQGQSYIAVDAPPEYEDSLSFASVAGAYQQLGVPVPLIYAIDHSLGFYCLQDFGDNVFSAGLKAENCHHLYRQALSHLPQIQMCTKIEEGELPAFDQTLLIKEFELFSHWLIEVHLKLSLSAEEKVMIEKTFEVLQQAFFAQPQVGVHRDYHSRNLMLLDNENIGIIDFQDAVVGPLTYDAASLLRDCYQSWPSALVYTWLKEWHGEYFSHYPWTEFKRWFDLTGMQRHVKASGIFARLCHRDGKQAYLADIPNTLQYLIEVGSQYPECSEFAHLVKTKIMPAIEQKSL